MKKESVVPKLVHQEIEPDVETKIVIDLKEAEKLQASGLWRVLSVEMLGRDEDTFESVKRYTLIKAPPKKIFS